MSTPFPDALNTTCVFRSLDQLTRDPVFRSAVARWLARAIIPVPTVVLDGNMLGGRWTVGYSDRLLPVPVFMLRRTQETEQAPELDLQAGYVLFDAASGVAYGNEYFFASLAAAREAILASKDDGQVASHARSKIDNSAFMAWTHHTAYLLRGKDVIEPDVLWAAGFSVAEYRAGFNAEPLTLAGLTVEWPPDELFLAWSTVYALDRHSKALAVPCTLSIAGKRRRAGWAQVEF